MMLVRFASFCFIFLSVGCLCLDLCWCLFFLCFLIYIVLHVFLGTLHLFSPGTFISYIFFATLSSDIRHTCPIHFIVSLMSLVSSCSLYICHLIFHIFLMSTFSKYFISMAFIRVFYFSHNIHDLLLCRIGKMLITVRNELLHFAL